MCSRFLSSILQNVNGDQSSILTLKTVTHYMNNWFLKHEVNTAKEVGCLGIFFHCPFLNQTNKHSKLELYQNVSVLKGDFQSLEIWGEISS